MVYRLMAIVVLAGLVAAPVRAQSDGERYTIMRPEPSLLPTYKSPRGTRQQVKPVRPLRVPEAGVAPAPPPIIAPRTGVALPNLPTISPSGPGGRETYQDRAGRCAHQAGVYGPAVGDRNAYIGTCINQ